MKRESLLRLRQGRLIRRFHLRLLLLAAVAIVVGGVAASLAFARTRARAIGTGVVVIDTNLAYENGEAAGTGMVLSSSGEVLTNNHVIRGATTIKIVVSSGHVYTAHVVGYDVSADVAVLQADGASNLKTISTGNSSTVKIGEPVTATGNAGGTGALTTSSGEITGLGKAITVSDDQGGSERLAGLIETSSRLEPGDSGGPLLNAAGRVMGMDTAASVGYGYQQIASNDGYAIPINRALAIAAEVESGKTSTAIHLGTTAFLGVDVASNDYGGSGVVIEAVVSGGPASQAGLTPGDMITSIGGHAVASPASLEAIMLTEKTGARVSIAYLDASGTSHITMVTLGDGPPQ